MVRGCYCRDEDSIRKGVCRGEGGACVESERTDAEKEDEEAEADIN